MGRGDGVEIRAASIRLFFVWQGVQHRETLYVGDKPMLPTQPNIAHAKRLAGKIRREIELGAFQLAAHFPKSKRAVSAPPTSFGSLADAWLASKGHLAAATRSQYRLAAEHWKSKLGSDTPIESISHAALAKMIGSHPWASAKLRNNYLIVLRGALGLHYRGQLAMLDPMIGITNQRSPRKLPDPLTTDERDRILADMRKHYDPRVVAYFELAFYTGMRPEELIALRWEDIDWGHETIRVQRVRTFKGSERDETKTGTGRDVDLVPPAIQALKSMKAHTFMKRGEDGREVDVFENPVTGRPWHDERSQRDHYWTPTLKRLGIRQRRAYCTRHTYCTVALMAGLKPAYIASQAGHSVKTLLEVYAKWIPGGDSGSQKRMLSEAMTSPQLPQASGG